MDDNKALKDVGEGWTARLQRIVQEYGCGGSSGYVRTYIENGEYSVNGKEQTDVSFICKAGDVVTGSDQLDKLITFTLTEKMLANLY